MILASEGNTVSFLFECDNHDLLLSPQTPDFIHNPTGLTHLSYHRHRGLRVQIQNLTTSSLTDYSCLCLETNKKYFSWLKLKYHVMKCLIAVGKDDISPVFHTQPLDVIKIPSIC